MEANTLGHFFEDFIEGETVWHSLSKTIFESDNNLFSLLTMNCHPIHTNIDFAQKSEHGKILVVGTLVLSLVVGLSVQDISGLAIANLSYEKIYHLSPVFIGDTIYARTTIISKKASRKPDRGVVVVETTGYNQDSVDVLKLTRTILVKRKTDE